VTAGAGADYRPPCPCCGGRMIIVYTFERGRGPRAPPSPQAGVTAGNCQPCWLPCATRMRVTVSPIIAKGFM
jgi:hypothetical protein